MDACMLSHILPGSDPGTRTHARPPCPPDSGSCHRLISGRLTGGSIFVIRCHNKLRDLDWATCPVFVPFCKERSISAVAQMQSANETFCYSNNIWMMHNHHQSGDIRFNIRINAHCTISPGVLTLPGSQTQTRWWNTLKIKVPHIIFLKNRFGYTTFLS